MTKSQQRVSAVAFGVVFIVALMTLAILIPNPTPFQYTVFRVVLALAVAGAAAMIPGFLEIYVADWIRAGGALAVFVVVYFYNPAALVAPPSPEPQRTGIHAREQKGVLLECRDAADQWWRSGVWRLEANGHQDNPNAVPHGFSETYDPTKENQPDWADRRGILVLHPIDENKPAIIAATLNLKPNDRVLAMTAHGSPNGDVLIRVMANGTIAGARIVDGDRWYTLNYDISKFAGAPTSVEIQIVGGGEKRWYFETAFIDNICVGSQAIAGTEKKSPPAAA